MPPTTAPIRCQTCGRLVSALHFETTPSHVRSPEIAPDPVRFVLSSPPPADSDRVIPVLYRREVEVPGEVLALQESPEVEGKIFTEITPRPEVAGEVKEDRSRPNPDYVNPPAELLSPDAKTTEELTDEFPLPDPDIDPEADVAWRLQIAARAAQKVEDLEARLEVEKSLAANIAQEVEKIEAHSLEDLRADPTLDNEPAANETL